MELPIGLWLLIPALAGCPPPPSTAREELAAYLSAHPDTAFSVCPEAETDDCGVNPDTAAPSAAVLDCVYAAKQACAPAWGCVAWASFDAAGEFCLLVEEDTCNILYFNPGEVQVCETMDPPEDCWPTPGACSLQESG